MKKFALLVLAALVLVSVFTGCSASAYMDDPYAGGYSNVSTTRNGTVNGTNDRYYNGYGAYGYSYDANGHGSSYNYNTTAPGNTAGSTTGTARQTTGSTTRTTTGRTGTYTGTTSGTGMTGGR